MVMLWRRKKVWQGRKSIYILYPVPTFDIRNRNLYFSKRMVLKIQITNIIPNNPFFYNFVTLILLSLTGILVPLFFFVWSSIPLSIPLFMTLYVFIRSRLLRGSLTISGSASVSGSQNILDMNLWQTNIWRVFVFIDITAMTAQSRRTFSILPPQGSSKECLVQAWPVFQSAFLTEKLFLAALVILVEKPFIIC